MNFFRRKKKPKKPKLQQKPQLQQQENKEENKNENENENEKKELPLDEKFTHIFEGHSSEIRCLHIYKDFLFTGSYDSNIKKWNIENQECLGTVDAKSYVFSLSVYKGVLYSTGSYLIAWDPETFTKLKEYSSSFGGYIFCQAFYENMIYTGGAEFLLRSFEIKDQRLANGEIYIWDLNNLHHIGTLKDHTNGVWALVYANGFLYSGSSDHSIGKWDLEDQKRVGNWKENKDSIVFMAQKDKLLFSGDESGYSVALDMANDQVIKKFRAPVCVWAVGVTENYLFLGSRDSKIRSWDISALFISISLKEDLQILFDSQEFCDNQIETFDGSLKIHSLIVFFRLKKKPTEIISFFENQSIQVAKDFFKWVYTGYAKDSEQIKEILKNLEINPENRLESDSIIRMMNELYLDEETKDFTILVRGEEIKAHKIILFARSEVFRGMFLSVNDSSNSVSDYSDKSPQAIKTVVQFLYTETLSDDTPLEVLEEIKDADDFYQFNLKSPFQKELDRLSLPKIFLDDN
ncbi:wd repeat-containing protein pop1 [Anaeramoeba ignava]|uniref:Wd repeat-containing protein pop1 n=1 Tax=Anaeramoeba ignava TaxID=1746090 RepID=A0A9Q0LGG0_ANAIG|nr:wd repeat-containing protein pop1 [Anaeramoeba ignava]